MTWWRLQHGCLSKPIRDIDSVKILMLMQTFVSTLREKCFEKCVTRPGSSLSGSEQACLGRCCDRYIDVSWKKMSAKGICEQGMKREEDAGVERRVERLCVFLSVWRQQKWWQKLLRNLMVQAEATNFQYRRRRHHDSFLSCVSNRRLNSVIGISNTSRMIWGGVAH